MKYFLLTFDRLHGHVIGKIVPFDDADEAVRERFVREGQGHADGIEIVVLGAADEDDLRKTHSRYFGGPDLDELTSVAG